MSKTSEVLERMERELKELRREVREARDAAQYPRFIPQPYPVLQPYYVPRYPTYTPWWGTVTSAPVLTTTPAPDGNTIWFNPNTQGSYTGAASFNVIGNSGNC